MWTATPILVIAGLSCLSLCLPVSTAQAKQEHAINTADTKSFARDKRMGASTIVLAGRYIKGAIKTKSNSKVTDLYEKPGNLKRARKDFYILNPNNIQYLSFPYGGGGLAGRVGSRIVVYRSRDVAENSHPTLEIFRPGSIEPDTRIIYGTKTKTYDPKFDNE